MREDALEEGTLVGSEGGCERGVEAALACGGDWSGRSSGGVDGDVDVCAVAAWWRERISWTVRVEMNERNPEIRTYSCSNEAWARMWRASHTLTRRYGLSRV